MMAISMTDTQHIHLYFVPSVHGPGSKLSPIRSRCQIGIAKAT